MSCYHLSHHPLLTLVGLCSFTNRLHVCRRLLISDNLGQDHISSSRFCIGESDTVISPLLPQFRLPTQYHSTTDVCSRLTHLPQKLYNILITQRLSLSRLRPCLLFLWRHGSPEWCRGQLRFLEFRGLDKILTEITVWKDAFSVAQLFATLPYKPEGREFDLRWVRWDFLLT